MLHSTDELLRHYKRNINIMHTKICNQKLGSEHFFSKTLKPKNMIEIKFNLNNG